MTIPYVVSHATAKLYAPENTVRGIQMAASQGAKRVEMDVRWSSSGYPVLMHDETINRTTTGTGTVNKLGLLYMLQQFATNYAPWDDNPAFPGIFVPYGWDFFNAINQGNISPLLDVKETPTVAGAQKLMYYADMFPGMRQKLIYMASPENVIFMRNLFPDLTYMVIEYPPTGRLMTAEYLLSIGAHKYAVPSPAVTSKAMVDYYHAYGIELWTWTSDTPALDTISNWSQLVTYGVDSIITNQQQQLDSYLATLN